MLYIASWIDCALTGRYVTWLPGARLPRWMLLTLYTLPQLAVSAKILCLLMVVVCGAVPSMVRSVRLYSQCSHNYISVYENGTVLARYDGPASDRPNLTISTVGVRLDLLIHSTTQNMYLCFTSKLLVGKRLTRQQAEKHTPCHFREQFVDGYNRYHLVKFPDRYIGFNQRGSQVRRPRSKLNSKQLQCLSFMKDTHDFDINHHNKMISELQSSGLKWRQQRKRVPKAPCRFRHRHGRHQRLRKCNGT